MMSAAELEGILARSAGFFNRFLHARVLPLIRARVVPQLADPMIYSLDAPGKRLRPVLCLWAAGVPAGGAEPDAGDLADLLRSACFAGAAVEAIHTYSLIHDDLPAMDDDDLRRGRPACHRQFSEWAAILAGDALNTFAFELLGYAARPFPHLLSELLPVLGEGAGRMVCGQTLDLETEKGGGRPAVASAQDLETARIRLDEIHRKKTAALIRSSVEMGALLAAGSPDDSTGRADFREYGEALGLLFQITDDLLDVQSDSAALGKTAGKDAASGKLTYPALYGVEESLRQARAWRERLEELAQRLPVADGTLRGAFAALPLYVAQRKS